MRNVFDEKSRKVSHRWHQMLLIISYPEEIERKKASLQTHKRLECAGGMPGMTTPTLKPVKRRESFQRN